MVYEAPGWDALLARISAYDRRLRQLTPAAVQLAARSHAMLAEAVRVLEDGSGAGEAEIRAADRRVDADAAAITDSVLELMSLQQPDPDDLRTMAAVLRIVRELERIADYAGHVAAYARRPLPGQPWRAQLAALGRSTLDLVDRMVTSLSGGEAGAARALAAADDEVDRRYHALEEAWNRASADGSPGPWVNLALIARELERIGDHAVNVGRMLTFAAGGRS
ncbi:Phosphate transport system regulatory protein PhoU [Candidatus Hydrogenisulfobacillus filiaventi]|uniref:Phosphate transport system regulatory protein PhoU n=1 Tax=Candidatus Hydrogenisulfobacillus filiaventi TaxID=2707344 RepID=A0A6F8ZGH0_9FIRM|nr:hypothetical protein [Bacillota bacterium]CAB1129040.1 Phosphate transport system regulatory protein PhoU [Candidatus Hydrogenisulfobacillus filiaventi]